MGKLIGKLIGWHFYLLAFVTPLLLWPKTSEVFEFNKIIFVYLITISVTSFWIIKAIISGKLHFVKSVLDVPLLLFVTSNIISTIFSIDKRTSVFGYYSRFNGGLLSTISYALLYWAYVSNMDKDKTKVFLKTLLVASLFVCIYAVAQHFGIDKNIWADDVVNRVFSTLGQPNWLAAWTATLLPLTWWLILRPKTEKPIFFKMGKFITPVLFILSGLMFTSIIFTKSRSGFMGFILCFVLFWGAVFLYKLRLKRQTLKLFLLLTTFYLLLAVFFGTPWTPSIESKITKPKLDATKRDVSSIIESGTSGSGKIRIIVWQGAFDIWKNYPVFGSGVETFAFTYQKFKPQEHNLTAEWDYVYNKAHNEYLNFLANNGLLGLITYLLIIVCSILQISKFSKHRALIQKSSKNDPEQFSITFFGLSLQFTLLTTAITAGYVAILLTNFLGFSVVPVSLLFYLLPSAAYVLDAKSPVIIKIPKLFNFILIFPVIISGFLIFFTSRYWYSDFLYARTNKFLESGNLDLAQKEANRLIRLSPNEPNYRAAISQVYAQTALYLFKKEDTQLYHTYIELAQKEATKAVEQSPSNVYFKRNLASIFLLITVIDMKYLDNAKSVLEESVKFAPTDAKLFYNLGLIYLKQADLTKAQKVLNQTVDMKNNYTEARYALALVYYNENKQNEAVAQLKYILDYIDPNNSEAKQLLKDIN